MYTLENAYNIIKYSLLNFFNEEKEHILTNVSERNLVGQLSYRVNDYVQYLNQNSVCTYYVDVEYNRMQNNQVKRAFSRNRNQIYESLAITTDLIVHTRGNDFNFDNFIAIEMKKSDRPREEKDSDRNRLEALTKPRNDIFSNERKIHPKYVCGYLLGVYIEIDIQRRNVIIEFYENGKKKSVLFYNL